MDSPVLCGLDLLLQEHRGLIKGRCVGMLCHAASVSGDLRHATDMLSFDDGVDLRCLFGPEHGVRADAQDMIGVGGARDPSLGIPVHSLYGARARDLRPRPEHLEDLDVVVMDLQDVGSRYYTYIWSMVLTMQACAEAGISAVILDRPNPLGGESLEGGAIEPGYGSFVGLHSVPPRHGLTAGEMALLVHTEKDLDLDLHVIPMIRWQRGMLFDQTGLPWVMPSPNMPTLDTALVYPGGCLLEGTNISEGRGTTRPFEIFGAPWVDGVRLARSLEQEDLPGVSFRPLRFQPAFHKHAGEVCGGVQIHVTHRRSFKPLRTGVACLLNLRRLWPEAFAWRSEAYEFVRDIPAIDLLAGGPWLRRGLERDATLEELTAPWAESEALFEQRRAPHLLYGQP